MKKNERTCQNCNADFSKQKSVARQYVEKDSGDSNFSIGHYDKECNFEVDEPADLSLGRYSLLDFRDECNNCYKKI